MTQYIDKSPAKISEKQDQEAYYATMENVYSYSKNLNDKHDNNKLSHHQLIPKHKPLTKMSNYYGNYGRRMIRAN